MTKGRGQTFLIPKVTQGRQELTARSYNEENVRKDLACAISCMNIHFEQ